MNILLIEDNPDHAEMVMDAVREEFQQSAKVTWKKQLSIGLALLDNTEFDICLCDLQLTDSTIENTVERLNALESQTPIVVLTSTNDIGLAKSLVKQGIQDYVPKENLLPGGWLERICSYSIERKQKQLLIEKRNEELELFCSSLSHDFKGPIRRVGSILEILYQDISERQQLIAQEEEFFSMAINGSKAILDLIDGLSAYLMTDIQVKHTCVSLNELLSNAKSLLLKYDANTDNIVIKENADAHVVGDHAQLTILFKNLIENGLKYNNKDPVVHVNYVRDEEKDQWRVDILDNGIGIPAEHVDTIFQPFQRLQYENEYTGAGLGLNIVKKIVQYHSGEISLQSTVGKGSTFSVSLPVFIEN